MQMDKTEYKGLLIEIDSKKTKRSNLENSQNAGDTSESGYNVISKTLSYMTR